MPPLEAARLSPALIIGAAVAAFVIAAVVAWLGARMLRSTLRPGEDLAVEVRAALQARARGLVAAVRVVAFGIAGLATAALAASQLGYEIPEWTPHQILQWMTSRGVHLLVIVAAAYLTIRGAHLAIEYFQYRASGTEAAADAEKRRRAATLGGTLASLTTAVVVFGAGLMVLRELAIDVLPILTGAGIAGLAVGFGAQNLVRDIISGFFLILEDQIRVGDLARIQGVTGLVEQINLRTIVLRDADGAVQVFPNGTVTTLANLSKEYAYAVVEVVVPLAEDPDRALAALEDVGARMRSESALAPLLLGPLEVLGIESLGDANATIRMRFRTPPLSQNVVARELRRRIAREFAARGIRPYGSQGH